MGVGFAPRCGRCVKIAHFLPNLIELVCLVVEKIRRERKWGKMWLEMCVSERFLLSISHFSQVIWFEVLYKKSNLV